MIRSRIREALAKKYGEHSFDVLVPPSPEMGDYSLNAAFILAKNQKTSPQAMAAELCEYLAQELIDEVERCEVAGPGFVNVFLRAAYLQGQVGQRSLVSVGQGKKVIVEYSAPNIAKPMSVGHLRSTIIGDGLARIHNALGYEVVRWNYIGDWGTQFGKLIAAWRRYGGGEQEATIANLTALYVKFHKEEEENPEIATLGQEEFRKLEMGDAENHALWQMFRERSLGEFSRMYARLGVEFDVVKGESSYQDSVAPTLQMLKQITTPSEGALVVMLDEYKLPPALVQKSDGSSIYIVRDIASLQDRIVSYSPTRILYVVGNEQSLHFEQLFAIKDKLRLGAVETVHVKFGLVLGEDGKKFSTRKGNTILLEDLMDELAVRTTAVVKAKNPTLSNEEVARTAEVVAIAALKYNDLRQHPHSDIVQIGARIAP
jgi:arginyl-tRNA synthetase